MKFKLLNANTTQKTKKVKSGFAFSFKLYACEFIDFFKQLVYRYKDIHEVTTRVVTGSHFMLQSRFSETESYTISMVYDTFRTMMIKSHLS